MQRSLAALQVLIPLIFIVARTGSGATARGFLIKLRAATLEDATTLFAWINDAATLDATIMPHGASWDEHVVWLTDVLQNPTRHPLIAEVEAPVGAVHIDYGRETEMTWAVAPEARGRGYGKAMVIASLPAEPVVANIKAGNVASEHGCQAAGFVLVDASDVQRWERR